MKKRAGRSLHWDESGTYGGLLAIHNYVETDGTEHLIFAVEDGGNTEIRERAGAASSTLLHTFTGTGKRVTLTTSSTGFAIFACEDNTYQKWDGTTVSTLSPPSDMDSGLIVDHLGRLWGDDKADPNKIHHSAIDDEDDWATTDNYGFLIMRMPRIKGFMSLGESGLVVCDTYRTVLVEGLTYQSFRQTELSTDIGVKAHQTMVSFGTFGFYLSSEGLISISSEGMQKVSLPREDLIDGWADAQFTSAKAFKHREFYILCYDSDNDGDIDSSLVFDTRYGVWASDTNQPLMGGTRTEANLTYVGYSETGKIAQYDTGTQDETTDFTMTVTTRGFDFQRYFARKRPRRVYVQAVAPGSATNLTMQLVVDGTNVGATQDIDLNDGEAVASFVDSGSGNVIQLTFTNSTAADVIELRSIFLVAEMYPAIGTVV